MLVRAGEFTSSLNLKSSRLAEITNMCHPPQFGWDSSDGKGKLNNGSVVPITAPEITTTNAVQNVQKNTNISPERRAKMELAAKTDTNKPEKMLYEQAISLRKQLLVDKIMKSGFRLKDLSDRFKDNYKSGTSLVSLSQKYVLCSVQLLSIHSMMSLLCAKFTKTSYAMIFARSYPFKSILKSEINMLCLLFSKCNLRPLHTYQRFATISCIVALQNKSNYLYTEESITRPLFI